MLSLKKFISTLVLIILTISIPLIMRYDSTEATDDWNVATPSSVGVNGEIINKMVDNLHKGVFGNIDSLLIIKNGKIVVEEYSNGFTSNTVHGLMSVTKSVTSALIGIAIEQKKIRNIDTKVLDYFQEYQNIRNMDPRKQAITIKDVITMTSGLEGNEFTSSYTDANNIYKRMAQSDDWIKFTLDLPMVYEPGEVFSYSSTNTMLLSSIIKKATGVEAYKYAEENLFEPLGITNFRWSKANNGLANTGGGLYLTSRDLAKIGQLYLNKGLWNGKQIIPEKWIKESTNIHVSNAKIAGLNSAYGYGWWVLPDSVYSSVLPEDRRIYAAIGYRGQYLFVIPEKNMVVVSTANNMDDKSKAAIDILYDYILKAVR